MKSPTIFQPKWYAVYTLPRLEKVVHNDIIEMDFESFLPTREVVRQWSDRKKKVQEPLFPNYVFVKTSVQERFKLLPIKGLVRFIMFENQPVEIPEKAIEGIKNMVSSNSNITCESYVGNIGDKVLIKRGQFEGIEGVVTKENGKNRLTIQIRALRQMVSVDISGNDLTLLSKEMTDHAVSV